MPRMKNAWKIPITQATSFALALMIIDVNPLEGAKLEQVRGYEVYSQRTGHFHMYIITLLEAAGCLGYVYPSHLSHSGRLIIPLQTDIYSKWVCDSPTPNLQFGLVFKVHLLTDSNMLYPYRPSICTIQ